MTREEAERRLGPPSGRWIDPAYKVQASYYERPGGSVSSAKAPRPGPPSATHPPARTTTSSGTRDCGIRSLPWLPVKDVVQVNVLRHVGFGGLTVFVSRFVLPLYLVLTARDGEAETR